MRAERCKQESGGFTLIEVMLTLLIMAGIMVTITQILTAARQTRDTIHNVQESQLAGPAILNRLERDLRGILTFNRDRSQVLRIQNRVLSGYDADTIDFVCSVDGLIPYRESENQNFLHADQNEVGIRLRIRPDSDDFLEIYRREDFGIDDEPFDGGKYSILHDRIKGFDIQVYEEDGPDAEPLESWGTDDDEQVGLPARIEIELTLELAPRLVREQLVIDRRTMVYRRIIRFPEVLRESLELELVALVPDVRPPTAPIEPGGGGNPNDPSNPSSPNDPGGPSDPDGPSEGFQGGGGLDLTKDQNQ